MLSPRRTKLQGRLLKVRSVRGDRENRDYTALVRPPRRRATIAATVCILLDGTALAAQTTGTVAAGGSWVDYEGFLGSGALYVTPALRYNAANVSLGASGSYVLFESGNRILQGLGAGAWRTRLSGPLRGEFSGSAGINVYADAPGYGHLLGRSRLHYDRGTNGFWISAATGRSYTGAESLTPLQVEVGGWTVFRGLALNGTAMRSWYRDQRYLDIVGSARWRAGRLRIDGSLGLRTWSTGSGQGFFGELHLVAGLHERLALQITGGRYPSDPVRGVIAANYVSIGVQLEAFKARGTAQPLFLKYPAEITDPGALAAGQAALTIESADLEIRTLCVAAPAAAIVELSADFTDWRAVQLDDKGSDCWQLTMSIAPGVYRVNVRLDGGQWIVPQGLRAEADGFGGRVGILVIP
jgi:hypothetical protein